MLLIAFILFIWFESDIAVSIVKKFKLDKKFDLLEYEKQKIDFDGKLSFPDFLHIKCPNFFTKLASCPICLCFWLTLIYCFLLYGNLLIVFRVFAIYYFINLVVYLLVKKLYDNQ